MLNLKLSFHGLVLVAMAVTLSACKNGGDLTLEPGATRKVAKGSPYVQVNNGGKALIYESTRTPATATQGVHGWVSVNAVTSQPLKDANDNLILMNRPHSATY